MSSVEGPGAGKCAETANASPATTNGENDVENGERVQKQAQFGDQSSRLPRVKIITVSIESSQHHMHLSQKYKLAKCFVILDSV